MKKLKKSISFIMALLISFSCLQLQYIKNEADPDVYAAEGASNFLLPAKTTAGATSSMVTAAVYDNITDSEALAGVSSLESTPDEEVVLADYDWLQGETVIHYGRYASDIREDVILPSTGENGSTISWTSSDETVVETDGTVKQPAFAKGDTEVTLTATISKGEAAIEKVFVITVISLPPTDEDSVAMDKAWLTDKLVLNGNSTDDVKTRLYLPTETQLRWSPAGYYGGCAVTWESSSPDVIGTDGRVTRPEQAQGDRPVTLTATISKGEAVDEKVFDMVVTVIEVFPLALKFSDFSSIEDRLQFSGISGIIDTTDRNGNSIKALQFNNDGSSSGGSVLTRKKLHLNDDMSFSTVFSFRNEHPKYTLGNGGFTFTLQAEGTEPSLNIAFDTLYQKSEGSGQASYYSFLDSVSVFYNGNNDASYDNGRYRIIASGSTNDPAGCNCAWIEYNGLSNTLEIRVSGTAERPNEPNLQVYDIDLGEIFKSQAVKDVYAGFAGSAGNAKDKSEIWEWCFKNDSTPIDFAPYIFIDASNITLSADPPAGKSSSTVTAYVYGDGGDAAGIPVAFSTDFGSLNTSSAVTDSSGRASAVLITDIAGTAVVRAIAAGGAMAITEIQLAVTDEDMVAFDSAWLTDERVLNGNSSLDNIIKDLYMPKAGSNGSTISWASGNTHVVTPEGKVTMPLPTDGDQAVKLTATISKGSATPIVKEFNITVRVLDTDRVAFDKEWLTDEMVLNGNSSLDNIIKDLYMPEKGFYNSTISWTSTNVDVVAPDGEVKRPLFGRGDQAVTLAASVRKGSVVLEKVFNVTVKESAPTDAEAVTADHSWLTDGIILNGNSSPDNITGNLKLPDSGPNGTAITWVSSNAGFITADGTVNRPTFTQGEKQVTLTAAISKGAESVQKAFELTVRNLAQTDAEAVAADKEWLHVSRTLDQNISQYSISKNLSLLCSAPAGSSITWASDKPEVISSDGGVTVPEYKDGHKTVILTATLAKGSELDSKVFTYTVLAKPDTLPPKVISTTPVHNSTGVLWDTREITITFDEDIKQGTLTSDYKYFAFGGIELQSRMLKKISARIDKNKLVITPFTDMMSGENKLIVRAGSVTDLSGNPVERFELLFTIEQKMVNKIEVVSSSPQDKERQVSLTPEISFRYNHSDIAEGRSFSGITLRKEAGKVIPVTPVLNGNEVTLGLSEALERGAVYEIIIPSGAVQDRFLNNSIAKTIRFRAWTDGTLPVITGSYPFDGQKDIDIGQTVEIYFSERISVYDFKLTMQGTHSSYARELEAPQKGVSIDYSLRPNTAYTLSGPHDSAAGIEYSMRFTTGAGALRITRISPVTTPNLPRAPINTPVEIEFSSPIARGAAFADIEILDSQGRSVAFSGEEKDNRAILTPVSELCPAETYTVHIPHGAYAGTGNGVNDTRRFSFSTAARLGLGSDSINFPSVWFVNKPVTFNTGRIEEAFKSAKYEITSLEWNFGDGSTGSGKNPIHTYNQKGEYRVTLRLKDNKGFSYEFDQMITIGDLHGIEMSVSSTGSNNLYVTGDWREQPKVTYKVRLECNGQFVHGESIKVQLCKNGHVYRVYPQITAGIRDSAYVFTFKPDTALNGTYELVFIYECQQEKIMVREPVIIQSFVKHTGPLRVRLYDTSSQDFHVEANYVNIELNGVKKVAVKEWQDDIKAYVYVVKEPIRLYEYYEIKVHGWTLKANTFMHKDTLAVIIGKLAKPGINRITADFAMSGRQVFIEGVDVGPVTFKFDGDWDILEPGYYEMKTDTDRLNFKSPLPQITFNPGNSLRAGEILMVRMVSKEGIKSPWSYSRAVVVPKPPLLGIGSGLRFSLVDGEYQLSAPADMKELAGGNIPLLDKIPLLSGGGFGFGADKPMLDGIMYKYPRGVGVELDFSGSAGYGSSKSTETPMKKLKKVVSAGYEITAEVDGYLWYEYDFTSKKWGLNGALIQLDAYGGYYWTREYKVPVIDVGAEGKLEMGVNIGGTLIIDPSDNSAREYSGIIRINPSVKVSVQVGLDWVNVTGYVKGEIPAEIHIPTGYIGADVSITAKVTGTFAYWTETFFKKELFSAHWDNGGKKVALIAKQPSAEESGMEDSKLELMARDYLNRESRWLAGSRGQPEELLQAAGAASLLKEPSKDKNNPQAVIMDNIYPEADVQLVRNGDELWLVWTDDNPERSAMNRTQLRYSVLKDGTWSAPAWIGQDGTADFGPVLASAGNGMLMAWQNVKQQMPDDSGLGSFIKNAEITVTESVYGSDGSGPQLITLTDDDKFDHSPKLAADRDNALLVWTKSEGIGFTLGPGTEEYRAPKNSDRLFFSCWNGSTWSTPAEIEGSLPVVMNSSVVMHGEEGLLLYALDMDDDLSTQEDREVFARIYDGKSWGEAIRLTDNQADDSNPRAVCGDGKWFITWCQDGNIMYKDGLDGETRTGEFLKNVQNDYEICIKQGERPQIALVYKHFGDDEAQGLSASLYDIDWGVWSDEIQLAEAEGYARSFSPVFTEDGKLSVAYSRAEIITEVIAGMESRSISDKVDLYILTYSPVHDLALLEEDGLELSSGIPLPGTVATISATVRNQGDFVESATVDFYSGNPKTGGVKIGEAAGEQVVPARSSAQVEIEWLVGPEEKDEYDIWAVVRPGGGVPEVNEGNNTLNLKILTADIAVKDLEWENLGGDDYLVTATIANMGSRTLEGVKVQLWHAKSGLVLENTELSRLGPGEEVVLDILASSKGLEKDESGNTNMTLRTLVPDSVRENSTDNNVYEFVLEPASIAVDRMNPGQDEVWAGLRNPLTLGFNMSVQEGAGFDQIVLEDEQLNEIGITKALEGDTLTVTPQSALAYNTRYTLTIPVEALGDSYGHTMKEPYSLSFVTTASRPEVIFTYPGHQMDNTALDTDIRIKFNQSVINGSAYGDIAMYGADSKTIPAEMRLQGEWLYVRPARQLEGEASYSLMIPRDAVRNDKGEALQEDYSLEFTTAKANAPGKPDKEKPDKEQAQKATQAEQPAYNISRQISADGRSVAVINVDQQGISKLKSDGSAVILDVSGVGEDETIQVNLSASALRQLAANGMGLNIVTGECGVRLPAGLIASLAGAGDGPVTITIAENNDNASGNGLVSSGAFDFSITAGGKPVMEFEQEVTVTISLDMSKVGNAKRVIACVYDGASGTWQPVGGVTDGANGSISFNTGHFSTYAAFETVKHFDDIISSWAKEKVEILASRRLINGRSDKTYDPEGTVSRAEFAAMIVRSLYTGLSRSKGTFADVAKDSWYADAVETAYNLGLVNGTGIDRFEPDANISREQLAVIAHRLYQYKNKKDNTDSFDNMFIDRQDISPYAEAAVSFAAKTGIMTGSSGRFEPERSTTRQEAAVVLYRLLEYMGEL